MHSPGLASPVPRCAALALLAARLLCAERTELPGSTEDPEVEGSLLISPEPRADEDGNSRSIRPHGHSSSELQVSPSAGQNFFCSDNCQYAGDVSEVKKTMYCQFLDYDFIDQRYKDGCSHKLPGFKCNPEPEDDIAKEEALKAYCVYHCGCESSDLKKQCEERHADQESFESKLDNFDDPSDSMMLILEDQMLAMFDDNARIPCEDKGPADSKALMAQADLTKWFPLPGAEEAPAVAPVVKEQVSLAAPSLSRRQDIPFEFPGSAETKQEPFTINPMGKVCLKSKRKQTWHEAQVVATISIPWQISKKGETVDVYGCVCLRYTDPKVVRKRKFLKPLGRCQNKLVHKFFCITNAKEHNSHAGEIAAKGHLC